MELKDKKNIDFNVLFLVIQYIEIYFLIYFFCFFTFQLRLDKFFIRMSAPEQDLYNDLKLGIITVLKQDQDKIYLEKVQVSKHHSVKYIASECISFLNLYIVLETFCTKLMRIQCFTPSLIFFFLTAKILCQTIERRIRIGSSFICVHSVFYGLPT